MVLRWLALTLLSLGALQVAPAAAQSVALDLTGCREPPESEVRLLAALELRGRLVDATRAAAELTISVVCSEARALLRSEPPHSQRKIDLSVVPTPLRARLLSLAIAELALVAPAEPVAESSTVLHEERAVAPLYTAQAPPARPPTAWAGVAAGGLELTAAPALGLAGTLSLLLRLRGPLALSGVLGGGQTRREVDRGTLRIRSFGMRLGPALLLARPRYLLHAGLAARISWLQLAGEADDPAATGAASFHTVIAGPAAFAGFTLALGRHLVGALEAELADQLRKVRAEVSGGRASTLSPLRASLSLLLGVRW